MSALALGDMALGHKGRLKVRFAALQVRVAEGPARRIGAEASQQAKEGLGLDHFEGRSWTGLYRQALMTMTAYAVLQHRRLTQAGAEKS